MQQWLTTSVNEVAGVLVSVVCVYAVVVVCIRLTGLRSLAKLSPTDFVWTIATGSLLASSIVSPDPTVLLAAVAFAAIFALQWIVAKGRRRWRFVESSLGNSPVLLMDGPRLLEENMSRVSVTRGELRAKLREANVLHLGQVRAVVMETTGDISVLHASDPDEAFDRDLLDGVIGA